MVVEYSPESILTYLFEQVHVILQNAVEHFAQYFGVPFDRRDHPLVCSRTGVAHKREADGPRIVPDCATQVYAAGFSVVHIVPLRPDAVLEPDKEQERCPLVPVKLGLNPDVPACVPERGKVPLFVGVRADEGFFRDEEVERFSGGVYDFLLAHSW